MKHETYTILSIGSSYCVFEFESRGRHGLIRKRATFIETEWPEVDNLAFGDVIDEDEIDDLSISDNGDRNKILATLAKIIDMYTEKFPDRWVYFSGSTKERTRLYRMAVGLNLEELSMYYEIFAETNDSNDFVPFHKTMIINAFLIKRKNT